jgi:putative glycosyl hydrolase-like family 15 (GHL15) protein
MESRQGTSAFELIRVFLPLALAVLCGGCVGEVRFVKFANAAFDTFTANPTPAQQAWMRAHYWRMVAFSPYFDSRLAWFPNAWAYKDMYGVPPGSALAIAHPEWILRDAQGSALYIPYACANGACSQYAFDLGNPAFRRQWLSDAATIMSHGYKGLFIDDVNMLMSRVSNGQGVPVTPVDPRTGAPMIEANWRRYLAEFTEQIRSTFPNGEIVHNVIWWVPLTDPYVQRELRSASFISLERGVNDGGLVGGGGTYGIETFFALCDWLNAQGRGVFFAASAQTNAAREYGLAAYFLIDSGLDTIGNASGGTPADWWTPYSTFLGPAAGPRYAWNGVLRRDFPFGIVLLNEPGAPQRTLPLGRPYVDLAGQVRTSVTLGAASGMVLLNPRT